ncbi:MAG: HlyD family secretion protein [Candidatus Binataceae bacterium]
MTDEKNDAQESEGESSAAKNVSSQDARAEKPKEETRKPVASQPPPLWPLGVATIFAAFFAVLVLWIIFRPRADVWTDDAYVTAHIALIAPRISGQVASVEVDDNQQVKVGQVLVTLDPRDYETAVAAAQAAVERDKAQYADASATLARQPPIIEEQEGNAAAARARLAFAEHDARRFGNLALTGAGTIQQQQQADTNLQESRAQLQSATASLEAANKQLDVLRAQQQTAKAAIMVDEARLAQAKLNLSYTRILAPVDGMVGQRTVQVGNVIAPGATLMAVVPLDQAYIVANYLEDDLLHVRAGQKVTIRLDAYRIDLNGVVDSIAPASGVSFAPIQPNNATGNFTKIVQRLPVKITVDPKQPLAKLLRVGFSVETTIHTGLEDVVNEQRRSSSRVTER